MSIWCKSRIGKKEVIENQQLISDFFTYGNFYIITYPAIIPWTTIPIHHYKKVFSTNVYAITRNKVVYPHELPRKLRGKLYFYITGTICSSLLNTQVLNYDYTELYQHNIIVVTYIFLVLKFRTRDKSMLVHLLFGTYLYRRGCQGTSFLYSDYINNNFINTF